MTRAGLLNTRRAALPDVAAPAGAGIWQSVILIGAAGVASAAIGQLLGRTLHLAWPIPASGSILAALPRALILLAILIRVNRFGALTAAAVAEIGAKLAFGVGGMWPVSLVAPLLGNLAGDAAWLWLRRLPRLRVRLALTGAALCTARVLAAVLLWSLIRPALPQAPRGAVAALAGIVAANMAFGAIAGLLVARPRSARQPAASHDQRN